MGADYVQCKSNSGSIADVPLQSQGARDRNAFSEDIQAMSRAKAEPTTLLANSAQNSAKEEGDERPLTPRKLRAHDIATAKAPQISGGEWQKHTSNNDVLNLDVVHDGGSSAADFFVPRDNPVPIARPSGFGSRIALCLGLPCWSDNYPPSPKDTRTETVPTPAPGPPPKAKPKGPPPPPKAKAKGKAPPPKAARSGSAPPGIWHGFTPPPGWKAGGVVNWNPIRQQQLLEGSIWQRVNKTIEDRGRHLLDKETLNVGFLRSVDKKEGKKKKEKKNERRILAPKEAFVADVLHKQLSRQGLTDVERLRLIVGVPDPKLAKANRDDEFGSSSSLNSSNILSTDEDTDSSSSDSSEDTETDPETTDADALQKKKEFEVTEDSLNTLVLFLRCAEFCEDKFLEDKEERPQSFQGDKAELPLAAADRLLRALLTKVGSFSLLESRVKIASTMTSFSREADELERPLRKGIEASRKVINSSAIPVLLEGVLLLGNYVNSTSSSLGSAAGITLESIAKLAHSKSLVVSRKNSDGPSSSPQRTNALEKLVRQLQHIQEPEWLPTLLSELQECGAASGLDCVASTTMVKDLGGRVEAIQAMSTRRTLVVSGEATEQFAGRLNRFTVYANPRLMLLEGLIREMEQCTVQMRKHFAEPQSSTLSSMLRNLALLLDFLPTKADPEPSEAMTKAAAMPKTATTPKLPATPLRRGSDASIRTSSPRTKAKAPPAPASKSAAKAKGAPLRSRLSTAPARETFEELAPPRRQMSQPAGVDQPVEPTTLHRQMSQPACGNEPTSSNDDDTRRGA